MSGHNSKIAPFRPLFLKSTWDNIDDVRKSLKKTGEKITFEHLRMTGGGIEEACLAGAARFGAFKKVLGMLSEDGIKIEPAEFLKKDKNGKTLLGVLVHKKEIALVVDPYLWAGRASGLVRLMEAIPEEERINLDFESVLRKTNQLTLRQKFAGERNEEGQGKPPSFSGPSLSP